MDYVFEVAMMVCFGFAWPANIYKSAVSKTSKGKSVIFLYAIIFGYICGMIHKIMYHRDWVLILYAINTAMVLIDLILYYVNLKRDRSVKM